MEAYNKKVMIVGMLLAIAMLANGQSFCHMSKEGLKACLPCVSGENAVDPPSSACCSAIAKADLQCFCRYKDSGLLSFYGVDPNQAMELPVKCKVVDSFHC
ncbi:Bifunctional inhibitor/plant lipid transfer protein/seed storage helical domain [Sesbania bispinosa]|nr:Bifunctional inhibitor/plant lipid transfer protein/seed storage helical domain [Sesbania bispinosa]KAJ1410413.1 Bifunctional inhibitor/plant lipid transfer protein/seed storage helical domain [Sesbania bispinosa]